MDRIQKVYFQVDLASFANGLKGKSQMRETAFVVICLLLILPGWVNAQNVPPPPAPVAESDLRDNSIKMRLIEIERFKRDATKPRPAESTTDREIRSAKTKENFEEIQKLQDAIIEAYTTGKSIDYARISRSASDIGNRGSWLNKNLFGANPDNPDADREKETYAQKSVRDLIIELDNAIGRFVQSPIFQEVRVVDLEVSEAARLELRNIVRLSNMLSVKAVKLK